MSASKRFPLWAIVLLASAIACVLAGAYLYVQHGITHVTQDFWGDDDTRQTSGIIAELGSGYPDLRRLLAVTPDPKTYLIPGLVRAKNIYASGDEEGSVGYTTDMVPQGVAVTDRYVIVSAYCESKDFHSVLWLLDKSDRSFVKVVVLDGCDHVGGIAYDPEHRILWVAAETEDGRAAAGCLTMDAIEAYDFDESGTCLDYERVFALDGIERSSFVTYFDNALYAGCFYQKKDGVLCCYLLGEDGLPQEVDEGTDTALPRHTTTIPDEIQGITFMEDMVMLSQSYGPHDAHIMAYDYTDVYDLSDLTDNNCLYSAVIPPYLEQISAEGSNLYLVFESSAKKYRARKEAIPINHVLKVDVSTFVD